MKARILILGLTTLLCALPIWAQDIPAGDDAWDSLGGGATNTTLTSADWRALCGVAVGDTAVQLKGFNLAGQGTADTLVTRLDNASFASGNVATVRIQLKALSMVNDGSHPCSPLTIRVRQDVAQNIGSMTITRTSAAGGTFTAQVPVNAIIEAVDANGNVRGSTFVSGVLGDTSPSPWAYGSGGGGISPGALATRTATATTASSWKPGVDPVTQQPVRVCRRGNKVLPAWHCYQPPPPCPVKSPTPAASTDAIAVDAEPCFLSLSTDTTPRQ
jgi:hypothetical protein